MEATRPAALIVNAVDLAAALVMTRPIDQRMAAFVDVARVYRLAVIGHHPQATLMDIREASRAFGFAVLHRLQSVVPGEADGWMGE